jgi:hypothetical protein
MNNLDLLLENLVISHAEKLGLSEEAQSQMEKEMSILAFREYNTRAELISLIKSAAVA